ncbi:RNA polymerase sigma factor [Sphingobacterium paludis]|jgi:RNA polymerase sigma factor (sigma-70 family)|uniref:RNA polymerase sigma factor n=1 Tax=Sphingobacterium paludis TaxID=1476465 RepID=A0A4R7CX73_9SPHI|nr:RNA polymerase sigma factor [Sphingobacterium paludis]TDS13123.1 RNA polymerase sigma-70 factor (ECF subfamily) [Sphingobacterium paludis]
MRAQLLNTTIEQNQPLLKRIATKFTQDPYEIEELVQETFIRSLSSLERFINHPKLVAWLFVIMRNVYINNYRKISKYRTIESELTHTSHFEQLSNNSSESKFVMTDIQNAINKLPKDYYIAFTMFMEGFKYQEIADHLAIAEGTVKTRIHMARKILKKNLKIYRK